MATAPRRETLIALRARRTAHQVASAVHLQQHSRPLLPKCPHCGREFLPRESTQTWCGSCWDDSCPALGPHVDRGHAKSREPIDWRAVCDLTTQILAFLTILFLFAALVCCTVKFDLGRVFGL
jgi:hypothetical protein